MGKVRCFTNPQRLLVLFVFIGVIKESSRRSVRQRTRSACLSSSVISNTSLPLSFQLRTLILLHWTFLSAVLRKTGEGMGSQILFLQLCLSIPKSSKCLFRVICPVEELFLLYPGITSISSPQLAPAMTIPQFDHGINKTQNQEQRANTIQNTGILHSNSDQK